MFCRGFSLTTVAQDGPFSSFPAYDLITLVL